MPHGDHLVEAALPAPTERATRAAAALAIDLSRSRASLRPAAAVRPARSAMLEGSARNERALTRGHEIDGHVRVIDFSQRRTIPSSLSSTRAPVCAPAACFAPSVRSKGPSRKLSFALSISKDGTCYHYIIKLSGGQYQVDTGQRFDSIMDVSAVARQFRGRFSHTALTVVLSL